MITYEDIKNNEAIKTYIKAADASLVALGYTEHSFAHVGKVAADAAEILIATGHDDHTVELAKIAAHIHDIGNLVNRSEHSQSGAVMAFRILREYGMDAEDVATVVTAIGNHAFEKCDSIVTLTIPSTVNSVTPMIVNEAKNLTTVYYNTSHDIGYNRFTGAPSLRKFVFGGTAIPKQICKDITEFSVIVGDTNFNFLHFSPPSNKNYYIIIFEYR